MSKQKEAVTPDERDELVSRRDAITDKETAAKEAMLQAQDARTEFDYALMQLRRKYGLRTGDTIDPETGIITRA